FLRPVAKGHEAAESGWKVTRPFFLWFDRTYYRLRDRFVGQLGGVLARRLRYGVVYLLIVVATGLLLARLPTAFLPDEDQGILLVQVTLPSGAPMERTQAVMQDVQRYFLQAHESAVASFLYVAGFSFGGRGQNNGMAFVKLRDWHLRTRPDQRADAVAKEAMTAFSGRRDALIFTFAPPAIAELGSARGFDFQLQDRGGLGHLKLMEARDTLLRRAAGDASLRTVRPNGQDDQPEYNLAIDEDRAGALGVPFAAISDTLSTAWGGAYVNDFVNQGRVKRVYLQSDAPFRMALEDLDKLYVRNSAGGMTPISAIATGRWTMGSPNLQRYNGFPSIEIQGEPAPGRSTGEAMNAMESLGATLPAGIGYEWTGLSYQERLSGAQAPALYAVSVLVIFLCLAALYESWSVPVSVLLILPIGVFGTALAAWGRGLSTDVYFQIGLLTTLGLAAKNAILIVQFAQALRGQGAGIGEAAVEASRLRLRPILMTSLAFCLGVLPMAIFKGAGAAAQNAIGTGVLGGMLAATFIAIYFIPLSYMLVSAWFGRRDPTP
ncbi:MAG TPA: efflux RND transporter permease subunit, partial [Holophagaceae bacterium]